MGPPECDERAIGGSVGNLTSGFPVLGVDGDGRRGGAVLDAEFRVDLFEVLVDGSRGEAEDLRDVAIGLAF